MILLSDTARGHNQHCRCQPGTVETTSPGSQFQVGCACLKGQNPSYPFLQRYQHCEHTAKVARVIFQALDSDPGPNLGQSLFFVSNLRTKWNFVTLCFRISLFWYILLLFSFKFENQTPVQNLSTIDANEIKKCFHLCNGLKNQANSCYCWKSKVIPGLKKCRILPEVDSGSMATSGTYFQVFVICNASHTKTNRCLI